MHGLLPDRGKRLSPRGPAEGEGELSASSCALVI